MRDIEESLSAQISFQNTRLVWTPFPLLRAEKIQLKSVTGEFPLWQAEEAECSFRFLPLLWGQVELSGLRIKGAQGVFGGIPFEGIDFRIRGLRAKRTVPFEGSGGIAGAVGSFQGKGKLSFRHLKKDFWKDLRLATELSMTSVPLSRVLKQRLPGSLTGSVSIEKEKGEDFVEGTGEFQISDLPSKAAESLGLEGRTKFIWKRAQNFLEIEQASLKGPWGELEGTGFFNVGTAEIEEARITGRKVVLEAWVRRFPNLLSLLPAGTGFSGASEFDLTIRGTWDYLTLHANWNLASAVLTYGSLFSKPQDLPMGMNFDLLLKGGRLLAGDFSLRIRQTTIKGALVELDLKTGKGEMTFLTNKFDLEGWNSLLPPFKDYQMSGSVKVLLSCKGNLTQPAKSEKIINLTLEKVSLVSPGRRGIRNAYVLIDLSPLSLRLKEARFQAGSSKIELAAEIYNPYEEPQGTIQLASVRLEPFELVENLKVFVPIFFPDQSGRIMARTEEFLNRSFPKSIFWEGVTLQLKREPAKLRLERLQFQTLDGNVHLQGEAEWASRKPTFWLEGGLDRISLARYFEGLGTASTPPFEGNLFFVGTFEGKGKNLEEVAQGLKGQGSLSITNGNWRSLDLAGPLQALGPFRNLTFPSAPSTPFHDLKATWRFSEGKFDTRDLLLLSKDWWIEGEGNLSLEGVLNSRLGLYFSKPLTQELLNSWGEGKRAEGKRLGPIPLLLIGSLTAPQIQTEEELLHPFLKALEARKYRKLLHRRRLGSRPDPLR